MSNVGGSLPVQSSQSGALAGHVLHTLTTCVARLRSYSQLVKFFHNITSEDCLQLLLPSAFLSC